MDEAEEAQKGQAFKTRLCRVKPVPLISTLGQMVPRERAKNVRRNDVMRDFLISSRITYDERMDMPPNPVLYKTAIVRTLGMLPEKDVGKYVWLVNYITFKTRKIENKG